jgi:SAM-dependent methyltransferase
MRGLRETVREWLREPRMHGVNVDSPQLIEVHRQILQEKPIMRGVFEDFYALCLDATERNFCEDGVEVEIGAGISLFKQVHPGIVVTDIKPSAHVDRVLDAQNMALEDSSVRAIYGLNCFHHLPAPRLFFAELLRVLKPQGGCVLIEPYYSAASKVLYPKLHATESYDMAQPAWESTVDSGGPMTGANQALSYIVFTRDRDQFEDEFPGLRIVETRPVGNYLRYLLSGGLNFKPLVPNFASGGVKVLEAALSSLNSVLALHQIIVLRKD